MAIQVLRIPLFLFCVKACVLVFYIVSCEIVLIEKGSYESSRVWPFLTCILTPLVEKLLVLI